MKQIENRYMKHFFAGIAPLFHIYAIASEMSFDKIVLSIL